LEPSAPRRIPFDRTSLPQIDFQSGDGPGIPWALARSLDIMRRFHAFTREFTTILIAIAVVVTARTSLADHYVVPSGSMEPTVEIRDHILVDKLA